MRLLPLEPKALSGAPLQLSLLVPFLFTVLGFYLVVPDTYPAESVDLPFSAKAPFVPYEDNDLSVSIQSDGMIFIDMKWYPAEEFRRKMLEFGERASSKHIVLRADRTLPFGPVRFVLLSLRSAGFTSVTLLTFEGVPARLIAKTAA